MYIRRSGLALSYGNATFNFFFFTFNFLRTWYTVFFLFKKYFIYLFLAVLGLHCCMRAFCSCGERGLLFVAVRGLIAVASRCGTRASVVVAGLVSVDLVVSAGSRAQAQ